MDSNFSDFAEIIDNLKMSIESMGELTEKLSSIDSEGIEKSQCITAMKDNIEIMMSGVDKFSEIYCGDVGKYNLINNQNRSASELKMKDTRILIVDDDEFSNRVVEQMLKHFNIEVHIAENGKRAIEMFKENEYDMILMDYFMPPGIDGVETVRRIRNLGDKGRKQLIVGITVNTSDEFKRGLNENNVELILMKPVKYRQMEVILRNELPHKIA